jgi:hypothetical protein
VNVPNPLPALSAVDYLEAARLYLVNCGICHGDKLDGNGPLYNEGNGPYQAAPKNLIADPVVAKMPEGTNVLFCYLWKKCNGKLCIAAEY